MKKLIKLILIICIYNSSYSQDVEYAKHIVRTMSSPEFKGRGYVENGDHLAAGYIVSEFKTIGVKALNGDYYQKFNVSVNTFPGKVSMKINSSTMQIGVDYLVESNSPSITGKFPIVKLSLNDILKKEVLLTKIKKSENAFLFLDLRKTTNDKDLAKQIDEQLKFIKYSSKVDCKGVIVYSNEKLTWEASQSQNEKPIINLIKEIDTNNIKTIDINIESKVIKKYETQNIIGIIKGQSKADSFIVITAHYDHLGKLGKEIYFPGANDNASGVAMLLSFAKYYSKNKPKYNTIFIAFGAEELGLLGSEEFVGSPSIDLKKIKFLVNFDLAGTGDEGIRVVNGSIYKNKFDILSKINSEKKLVPKVDIRGEACISDHCKFYQKGVPCFYIYTQGGIKAYHDINDKAESLPFTEFDHYFKLMLLFFTSI